MKNLLFLFSALLFISCSGDDDSEITFLEKYDGVMFQKEFKKGFSGGFFGSYNYDYEYFSFHNEDRFLVNVHNIYVSDIGSIDDEGRRDIECINFRKNNEDIDILVNTENEFKYRNRILNSDGTKSEFYFRFLAVGDSLSITHGSAIEVFNYKGAYWQRSLAVISDVCTN